MNPIPWKDLPIEAKHELAAKAWTDAKYATGADVMPFCLKRVMRAARKQEQILKYWMQKNG